MVPSGDDAPFEVYGQALQGRHPTSELLDGIVESWVTPIAAMVEAFGVPHEDAHAFARLGIAVTRGLLLDLLTTEDRAGVDAAMEQWIAINASYLEAIAGLRSAPPR